MKIDTLAHFWKLISQIKNNESEEMYVNFLRKYTEGAFKCLILHRNEQEKGVSRGQDSKRKINQINVDSSLYLSLEKFWEIGQETNKQVSPKTREFALTCLIELLSV